MSKPKLYRTDHIFEHAFDAVEYFDENCAEGVPPIPSTVQAFLEAVEEYDGHALFVVQPGFATHYIAAAAPEDTHLWLYAKPYGVTFALADERNVEAVHEMWGEPTGEVPPRLLPTDVWFAADELFTADGQLNDAVDFCLRLASIYATPRV